MFVLHSSVQLPILFIFNSKIEKYRRNLISINFSVKLLLLSNLFKLTKSDLHIFFLIIICAHLKCKSAVSAPNTPNREISYLSFFFFHYLNLHINAFVRLYNFMADVIDYFVCKIFLKS